MTMPSDAVFAAYRRTLRANQALGNATEHTHRPALKILLEADGGVTAVNEPKRIECGAPDFVVTLAGDNPLILGYVEAKDISVSLSDIERESSRARPDTDNGQQFKRYRNALPNLILTDYIKFRWYVGGQLRGAASLDDPDGVRDVGVLLRDFLDHRPQSVANPEELALRMARLTHLIRDVVAGAFEKGEVSDNVHDLHDASRQALVPDLTTDAFADMFAQTLAYGLFAARVSHAGQVEAGEFRRNDAAHMIPTANPFIRRLFGMMAGPDLDAEPFVPFVDDLTQLLSSADMAAIFANFGQRAARQDPIMHFYETFLAAYDPALRESRGVYYTPEPVISFIVRSVDLLLRKRFGCANGLADNSLIDYEYPDAEGNPVSGTSHRVLVLDPACGTGSFLYAVIDHVREHFQKDDNAGMWNGYVKEHLLPRMLGFELLMAPYAMAHLKLGMQLAAQDLPAAQQATWAYQFSGDERLGVYLTNSLEQAEQQVETMFGPLRAITDEANAAAEIKRDLPIMVVIGNPPYSGHSANKGEWIANLVNHYKTVDGQPLGERNPKWLQDDYVKFIRFGQWRIQQTGAGILAYVTNHGYLDNPTFRGMRQQLLDTFTDIYLLDLHGNSNKRERTPNGGVDQNVFDIQQGVSIAIFVKEAGKRGPAKVRHADLWGTRDAKYASLSASDLVTTDWQTVDPESPDYRFKPWDKDLETEYGRWPSVSEIMDLKSVGIVTARDSLTIHCSRDEVMPTVRDFAALPTETARNKYHLGRDVQDWKVQLAQEDLNSSAISDDLVAPILYRPFDTRYTYYTGNTRGFICRPRREVMYHVLAGENLGLITTRQTRDDWSCLATSSINGHKACAAYDISYTFPLYRYPTEPEIASGLYAAGDRETNLAPAFTDGLRQRTGLEFIPDGSGDLQDTFGPEDVFDYIYGVFHSPTYRERYDQFLRADFPRVPPPSDAALFRELAGLGRRLVRAHLLHSDAPSDSLVSFPVAGDNVVARGYPKYSPGDADDQGRVYINRSQYFTGITPEVWEFCIGGYQPMDKWLKDRRRRALSPYDDLEHYRRMAAAIAETIAQVSQIDSVIESAGGLFG